MTKLFLSGVVFTGGLLILRPAGEPSPQEAVSKSGTKNAALPAPAVSREGTQEPEVAEDETASQPTAKESPDQGAIKIVDDAFVKAYEPVEKGTT